MRNVVGGLFITLDGVVEAPEKWSFEHFDEDMGKALSAYINSTDTALLGRVTYQEWAPYWPTSKDEPFASWINNVPKYVASKTLRSAGWKNSTLVKEDLHGTIARLKQQSGKNIGAAGSPTLVRSLLQDGLLDELILMVYPVVVGKGKRLFTDWRNLTRLQLVGSERTRTGVAILTYQPRRS